MLDNYDSFTYNLVQYFEELDAKVQVHRNDKITLEEIKKLNPEKIIISPGPCTPDKAGISLDTIKYFLKKIPILGVCLGHQSIGQAFGGKIVNAKKIMHGRISHIYHNNTRLFKGLINPIKAIRYNSLVIDKMTIPDCLKITAWTQTYDGQIDEIMGIHHNNFFIEGVQFHPESILTEQGHKLLKNFLDCNISTDSP